MQMWGITLSLHQLKNRLMLRAIKKLFKIETLRVLYARDSREV